MNDYEDKVVLITGGGTGIGKATAAAFVEEGATVVIAGRREAVLEATAKELGDSAHPVVADISKNGQPKALVDETISRYGQLDVLVNNAGGFAVGPVAETSDEDIVRVYSVNVFGLLALSREALPYLAKTKGSIVNVSSTVSESPGGGFSVYASSKAAVDSITRTLATECGPSGVRVNAVSPGFTVTDMSAEVLKMNPQMGTMMIEQTPLGRAGEPVDIARAIRLLASSDAGWITGQVVQVAGGLSM